MQKIAVQCQTCNRWFDNSLPRCPYCNSGKPELAEPEENVKPRETIDEISPTDDENVSTEAVSVNSMDPPSSIPEEEEPQKQEGTLGQQIERVKKTVGRYIDDSGETISPVVGWLVGVKGKCFGQSFPIWDGKNKIGRSADMEVSLLNDDSVSRSCEAMIVYDSRANAFHILPGESGSLGYVDNEPLYERMMLKGMEEIEFGNSGRNKYIFVPLCGDCFQWSSYSTE